MATGVNFIPNVSGGTELIVRDLAPPVPHFCDTPALLRSRPGAMAPAALTLKSEENISIYYATNFLTSATISFLLAGENEVRNKKCIETR